ncbi:MAG: hypothetical protein IT373_38305 [Polyangiaceae bacterium]|nr:hypothetical protein [Polyangiaceae bacterium]
MTRRLPVALVLGAALGASARPAHADGTKGAPEPHTGPSGGTEPDAAPRAPQPPPPPAPEDRWQRHPYTFFQLGPALLALPAAEVCPVSPDKCEPGETSLAVSVQNLYRVSDFAFGASATFGIGLRRDAAVGDPALERDHTRSYFLVEGLFRYYLPGVGSTWQWWIGPSLGVVILNDTWSVLADREPYSDTDFVGPRNTSMATEGAALGIIAVGGAWAFADEWLFGTHFRYSNWVLPSERNKTPTNDYASLAGRIDVFDVGLELAYRLAI